MSAELSTLVGRLEIAVKKLEIIGGTPSSAVVPPTPTRAVAGPTPVSNNPSVLAFDELVKDSLEVFFECSKRIGGDVLKISELVKEAFQSQRDFLIIASQSKQPSDAEFSKILEPLGSKIQNVINFRESHRTSPLFNHLSAVSESIPGLSWVAVAPAPGPYVKEMGDAAMFYSNRVLKDFRGKDKSHVEWVQNWTSVFSKLQSYIKIHHTTGVTWNPVGGNVQNAVPASAAISQPSPGPPPPPPPPMMQAPQAVPDDGRAALFEQINQGTDITGSLKKVSDDVKTNKNPNLRAGPRPFVKTESSSSPSGPIDKPPKFALEGKKWFIEYQKNGPNIVLDKCLMDQSVYIYKCQNTAVQVKGKVNQIIMDSCKKSSVVFDSLVSAFEIVNCQSCKMQVLEFVPTLTIEKTDGCQVYLSDQSLKVEIVTAKSSEMNIMIPKGNGEFSECPVPEQYKTTVDGLRLRTVVTEKVG